MCKFKLILSLFFCLGGKLFSQPITINGPSSAEPGSQHTYVAQFNYTLNASTVITWNVSGGAIISQNTSPLSQQIFCTVLWGYGSLGGVSISESIAGGYKSKKVLLRMESLCAIANAGNDITICSGSSIIGTPAVSGFTYSWLPVTGLSNPNIAQPIANPSQTTTYTVIVTSQNNLLQNGDFEAGLTGFSTDYSTSFPNGDGSCGESRGALAVTSNPSSLASFWCNSTDHSPIGDKMLFVDGTCAANRRVWYSNVAVTSGTNYYFSGFTTAATPFSQGNPPCNLPRLRVRINGIDIIQNFTVPFSGCEQWSEFSGNWTANSTTALIEIFDDTQTGCANDFTLDDLFFADCARTTDQVNVTTDLNKPVISPLGPIDYYYYSENYLPIVGIPLTSSVSTNNQWYKDGIIINGATANLYHAKEPGTYSVRTNSCESGSVTLNIYPWGTANTSVFGTLRNYPVGINSPSYYCKNSTGVIRQFDLGTSANYFWETYEAYNNPQQPQLYINPATYDVHNYQADVIINPNSSLATYTYVLGYAVQPSGYTKAMEFTNHFYSPVPNFPSYNGGCVNTPITIPIYDYNNSTYINSGSSGFFYERYDVGPSGTIVNPGFIQPDPSDPTNSHKTMIRGNNVWPGRPLRVSFSSFPATVTTYFHSFNGEECFRDTRVYNGYACRTSNPQSIIYPNPASSEIRIQANKPIESIEISSFYFPLVKKIRPNGTSMITANIRDLKPGLYTCKVVTNNNIEYLKLFIQRQ